MKATLTYILPDEQFEFDAAVKGTKAQSVLHEMDEHLRAIIKYEDGLSTETYDKVQSIRDFLREKCIEDGINL